MGTLVTEKESIHYMEAGRNLPHDTFLVANKLAVRLGICVLYDRLRGSQLDCS
jgi:hypothetical protein